MASSRSMEEAQKPAVFGRDAHEEQNPEIVVSELWGWRLIAVAAGTVLGRFTVY
jgi:hypothetical protein